MSAFYAQYEYYFAAAQLTLAMAGMGLTMGVGDFLQVFRFPKALLIGILCQLIIVPAAAFGVVALFDLPPAIAIGFILVAAVPGGTISNIFTHLVGANVALSISLTAILTVTCLFTTPLLLNLGSGSLPADFTMPVAQIFKDIILWLLLPLGTAMALATKMGESRHGTSKWLIRASLLVLAFIVVGSLKSGRIDIKAFGIGIPLLVIGFSAVLQLASFLIGKGTGLKEDEEEAIRIEVTLRNINLAVLLAASLFPASAGEEVKSVLYVPLFYGGATIIIATGYTFVRRRLSKGKAS